MKLTGLKRELIKLLNEEFFIVKNCITNSNGDFKIYFKNNELVLEGELNPIYSKVRNCIYSNFINLEELKLNQ